MRDVNLSFMATVTETVNISIIPAWINWRFLLEYIISFCYVFCGFFLLCFIFSNCTNFDSFSSWENQCYAEWQCLQQGYLVPHNGIASPEALSEKKISL